MNESNITTRFIKEYSIVSAYTETVGFQEMYNRFIKFCKNDGEKTITKITFNKELKKLGFSSKRANSGMVWLVALK